MAGVLLGCAEAAATGLDTAQVSAGARGRLLYLVHHGPSVATMPDDALFSGWAGVAVAGALTTPHGVTWSNTEHTRTPPELPPEPGFMQGAAGIAGWLARLHARHTHPDTPPPRPGSTRHGFDRAAG
jgi:hypothetical protein